MTVPAPLLSSNQSDWTTPEVVLTPTRRVAPIGLDPCSNPRSIVAARMAWSLEAGCNGLGSVPWKLVTAANELIFVNPPYGRGDAGERLWIERCRETGTCRTVIALVPAKTSIGWWHRHCIPGETCQAVAFWRGRLKFGGAPSGATFPSALVLWTPYGDHLERFAENFLPHASIWV